MTQKRISSFISVQTGSNRACRKLPVCRLSVYRTVLTAVVLLVLCVRSAAQSRPSAAAARDTVAFFRGVAVSVDVVGAVQRAVSDYGQYEAALRISLRDRYFPVFELGYGTADASDPSTRLAYKTSAPYGRIGVDFNIARNKHDDYRIYVGARYALTYYKFDVTGSGIKDPVWGDDVHYEARGIKANSHWLEGVFGVDAKIAGPLRLGWSVRYRRHLWGDDGTLGNTWYVPGYGKQGGSRLGGTFNVIFEL